MQKREFTLVPIGYVESEFASLDQCPFQGDETCPPVRIHIHSRYTHGLVRLHKGLDIEVITYLDRASRDILQCRPRNNPDKPLHGVFATRSPNRPNPIGLHRVRILNIDKDGLIVHPLEVLDRTPVVDIKPVLKPGKDKSSINRYFSMEDVQALLRCSEHACSKQLLNGLNGNLSIRRGEYVLITRSHSTKGLISIDDLCVIELKSGSMVAGKGKPSSETAMHTEIYKNQPLAGGVAHTHPATVLTLDGISGDSLLSRVDLFEARAIRSQLSSVPDYQPGTADLAEATGSRARKYKCILMKSHGLTCWGESLAEAVGLCDELEALARIELNTMLIGKIPAKKSKS